MVDREFCDFLEYKLGQVFANSKNEQINHFWCDGVLLPTIDKYYSKKFVNDNREIPMMKVFAGLTGQDEYELTLKLGSQALSKYAREMDITGCLDEKDENWFEIDIERKKIVIQLT